MWFILTHNYFVFGGSHYLQVQGVAMGTTCAPPYANMYLAGWEHHIFSSDGLSKFDSFVFEWHRYIDYILLLWTRISELVGPFLNYIIVNMYNISFTMNFSSTNLPFSDLMVFIQPDHTIATSLFRKHNAGNSTLHANSQHPTHLIQNIPTGQYLQLRLIVVAIKISNLRRTN